MNTNNNTEEQYNGGPRTPAGKIASSQNSFKHGMCSSSILIPGEDAEAFESLVDQMEKDHEPCSVTEQALIHDMAKFHWLTNRAIALQQRAFLNPESIDTKFLALMIRYQNTNHRSFLASLKALQSAQKERVRKALEFDPEKEYILDFSKAQPEGQTEENTENTENTTDEPIEEPRIFLRPPGKLA